MAGRARPLPDRVDFSVVVPLYNEEPNVDRLLHTTLPSLERNPRVRRFELVCVDDGSADDTRARLERARTDRVVVLSHPTRRGQSGALATGIAAARYDVVGVMDADLQTTPDDFVPLLQRLDQGFDCAHGIRVQRRDPVLRLLSSRVANAVRRLVLGDPFYDIGCPLSVFRRGCLEGVPLFEPFHRYLPFLIQMQGYRVTQVPVRHFPRAAGQTKYGIVNRLGVGLRSLLHVRRLARRYAGARPNGAAPP